MVCCNKNKVEHLFCNRRNNPKVQHNQTIGGGNLLIFCAMKVCISTFICVNRVSESENGLFQPVVPTDIYNNLNNLWNNLSIFQISWNENINISNILKWKYRYFKYLEIIFQFFHTNNWCSSAKLHCLIPTNLINENISNKKNIFH